MNLVEIENEIAGLEQGETTWASIQRLSWLYTVRDHLGDARPGPVLQSAHTVDVMPDFDSEFGHCVCGVDVRALMGILSEHMDVVKILYPKEYQAVLDRIAEIP